MSDRSFIVWEPGAGSSPHCVAAIGAETAARKHWARHLSASAVSAVAKTNVSSPQRVTLAVVPKDGNGGVQRFAMTMKLDTRLLVTEQAGD